MFYRPKLDNVEILCFGSNATWSIVMSDCFHAQTFLFYLL